MQALSLFSGRDCRRHHGPGFIEKQRTEQTDRSQAFAPFTVLVARELAIQ
jgi:hypothetical protein